MALEYLTYFGVVILLGLICTILAQKLKLPNVLFLIVLGIILNKFWDIINFLGRLLEDIGWITKFIPYETGALLSFPIDFTTTIALFALIIIVFDSASHFKYKEFDDFSLAALELTGIYLLFNVVLLTPAVYYIFALDNIYFALLFSTLIVGTAADIVLSMVQNVANKAIKLLEIESLLNTPFIVLFPFIILDFMQSVGSGFAVEKFVEQGVPFLQQIITGVGAGVLIGIIVYKVMRRQYSKVLSPLVMIASALLTYVISEQLGGNGILAVTVMGLFFGNVYVKQKKELQQFTEIFSLFLEIFVFVLVGLLIDIPWTFSYLGLALLIFVIIVVVRFLAIAFTFRHKLDHGKFEFTLKEKLFMSLVMPKGIAVAVVAATLVTKIIPGIEPVLNLTLIVLLYSIILSSIIVKLSKLFLNVDVVKKQG